MKDVASSSGSTHCISVGGGRGGSGKGRESTEGMGFRQREAWRKTRR